MHSEKMEAPALHLITPTTSMLKVTIWYITFYRFEIVNSCQFFLIKKKIGIEEIAEDG